MLLLVKPPECNHDRFADKEHIFKSLKCGIWQTLARHVDVGPTCLRRKLASRDGTELHADTTAFIKTDSSRD